MDYMTEKLNADKSVLVIVDVQGKLAELMYDKDRLFENIRILIQAAEILDIPIIWAQQCPDSLGATVPSVSELLEEKTEPINKATFSCCDNETFIRKLKELSRNQILLCGIETHICIYQTAVDLKAEGRDVTVIADAVSSRTIENKDTGIERLRREQVKISSTEMAIFEIVKTAEHPNFRKLAKLIK
jgi:nicotinamidase-related amidase